MSASAEYRADLITSMEYKYLQAQDDDWEEEEVFEEDEVDEY